MHLLTSTTILWGFVVIFGICLCANQTIPSVQNHVYILTCTHILCGIVIVRWDLLVCANELCLTAMHCNSLQHIMCAGASNYPFGAEHTFFFGGCIFGKKKNFLASELALWEIGHPLLVRNWGCLERQELRRQYFKRNDYILSPTIFFLLLYSFSKSDNESNHRHLVRNWACLERHELRRQRSKRND